MKSWRHAWTRRAAWGLALALLVLGITHRAYFFEGNLHPVLEGEVYRAAQPTAQRLANWTEALGLRAVINLKGNAPVHGAADDGGASANRDADSLAFHPVRISARRLPSPAETQRLIAALDSAPRPLLIHCHGGTDRSGLASAVTLLLEGRSIEEAREQFALAYGYPGRTLGSVLPDFLSRYEGWLTARNQPHTPERFRDWVARDYVVDYYEAELAIEAPAQSLRAGERFSLFVNVTNRSPEAIPMRCNEGAGVRLSLRVEAVGDSDESASAEDAALVRRTPGERRFCDGADELAPGESTRIEASRYRIAQPGRYAWSADLVDEHREHWFQDMGSARARSVLTLR
ncbi:MAG: tyrosine-protein phosphatase [Myxococcota bacterium]|jgi:protein tyrosine phosphatase (PTP) superfamily phosphohydrolase (DUF442 family)|nr:tyrosine-protein phosphatase [Myxococcota bacterium]